MSSINIMNTTNKQWHTVSSTPAQISHMWTAVVGDVCYFMGGHEDGSPTDTIHSVSLSALVSQVNSEDETHHQIWKRISGLGLYYSTPLSIGGSLFALGG